MAPYTRCVFFKTSEMEGSWSAALPQELHNIFRTSVIVICCLKYPERSPKWKDLAPSRKSTNRALRRLINQRYESVFWGRWSSKVLVFACFFCEVMTTALMSVGYGSLDICPMISPESFSVIVIFQSSNLNTVCPLPHSFRLFIFPNERPRPRAHMCTRTRASFFLIFHFFIVFFLMGIFFFSLKSFFKFKKL